eukprot:CAMPEP_0194213112 /NCGR_PEP_ID=MMETSP0156-20130528/13485_1 /TAXON_ID=33649 /ORGANISM="Thalassionema nitzschioides, Strain L26-B" /LENGTH=387 /DNA_ID=CAMNT_0038941079 /DNA_START=57 /DNA_END=1220 /DNA_ORIENTATION=+
MKKTSTTWLGCILLLLCMLGARGNTDVYKTRTKLSIGWVNFLASSEEEAEFSIRDLSQWSERVAPYLKLVLSSSQYKGDEVEIIDVVVAVDDQRVNSKVEADDGIHVWMESTVSVSYISEIPIEDLPTLLEISLTAQNGIEAILREVASVQAGSQEMRDLFMSIAPEENDTQFLYSVTPLAKETSTHPGLIIACTLLVISLLFVTAIVIWMAGGFPGFWSHVKNGMSSFWQSCVQCFDSCAQFFRSYFQSNEDENEDDKTDRKANSKYIDNDAETTASGILGARPSYDTAELSPENAASKERKGQNQFPPGTLPVGFTPKRGVFREQDCDDSQILTPMSTNTDFSSSRVVPLGIAPSGSLSVQSPENRKENGDEQPSPGYLGKLRYY